MNYIVPFVNYVDHYKSLEGELDSAIKGVLQRGDLILRRDVREFEERIADFIGVKYAIGVSSCTDALSMSMMAAGIGAGDEVITVGHTFLATVEAIAHCGADPVLIDVNDDFCMNPEFIEGAITTRTKAIIPVHLNGRLCDMERIVDTARKHNLVIIEDSAQALGASFDERKGGAWGAAGCFSFYPAKLLGACGDAGLVSTNDPEIDRKVRLYRDHGRETKDEFAFYGFTNRMDNLQAAILNVKLGKLPGWLERRKEIAERYFAGLKGVEKVILPPRSDARHKDVYQNYVIRVEERDHLAAHLKEKGIEIIISNPIALNKQRKLPLMKYNLPVTERLADEVISIPLIPELTNDQIDYVIEVIREYYQG